ncbi:MULTISPECIES: hypothetical protein [unclassified Microbacterium]|uniref:hypothetical protein n=1 Tax=unclassified Microbacterium TaxID=2609290 RepID=UPI001D230AB0|nr:hypothetical protein [Microbacterium sp. Bi121]CAH0203693.1 hypothetical protein SRABI121_02551 [Microbacterium sp. Bi121]
MNSNLRTRTRLLLALPVAAVAISLTACSGGGAGRPSADELSDGIASILEEAGQGDALTDEQLDCVADAFLESEVSDQDLANLAEGKDLQTSQDAKDLVSQTMAESFTTCAS